MDSGERSSGNVVDTIMATSAATVEDIMSNKMPSDWREQLKAMPEVQAARAEFARDFAQVRALQKLQLPPSHIWLYQSQTSFDAVPPLVAFLQELGFGQQHLSPELETTSHLSQLSLCDASTFHTLVSPLSPQQRKDLGLLSVGSSENDDKSAWLDALAKLALQPAVTLLVLFHFRPILIDIAARWILLAGFDGQKFAHSQSDDIFHILQAFSVVLGYHHALFPLLQVLLRHPRLHEDPFALLDTQWKPVTCDRSTLHPSPTPSEAQEIDRFFTHPQLVPMLWTLYRLLSCDQNIPFQNALSASWRIPSDVVHATLMRHPNMAVRLMAWRVFRLWTGALAEDGQQLLHKYVCAPDADGHCPPWPTENSTAWEAISHRTWPLGQATLTSSLVPFVLIQDKHVNAWHVEHEERMHVFTFIKRLNTSLNPELAAGDDMQIDTPQSGFCIDSNDLTKLISVIADNVILPNEQPIRSLLTDTSPQPYPSFVLTPPSTEALRQVALAFYSRTPILLSAPPASGKSSMIAHLAASLGSSSVVSISLADRSIDAKSLLGSLSSSSTQPGTFTFIEGTLTRCLKQGKWLVLDDIEMAAPDVLALISTLAERMRERALLSPAGAHGGFDGQASVGVSADGRWVSAREGFALFATSSSSTTPRWLGSQFWTHVSQRPLELDDMALVLSTSSSRIQPQLLQEMLSTWEAVQSSTAPGRRQNTFRDLCKWCRRVDSLVPSTSSAAFTFRKNPTFQEESFLEAVDVFFSSLPDLSSETAMAHLHQVAETLGLSPDRADWLLTGRTPECVLPTHADASKLSTMKVGRITLPRRLQPLPKHARPFALTKPSISLMERLAVCTHFLEPVLLVGETGTGKTTTVSQLAMLLGHQLISLNMSNQSEASDLIGGFKPIDIAAEANRSAHALVNDFTDIFDQTFGVSRNADFIAAVRSALSKKRWTRLVALFRESSKMADKKLGSGKSNSSAPSHDKKRRKTEMHNLETHWQRFREDATRFETRFATSPAQESKLSFAFVEGPLVKAIQQGHWILLDEINLASAETLESIGALLSTSAASLVVTERGDLEPVQRHPDFRIFACMNPATDVGKRDLPPALRAKLTEIYVPSPDTDRASLLAIVEQYIGHCSVGDRGSISDVADLYSKIKTLALSAQLADGANSPPHYSVRTLARALTFASDNVSIFGLRRALYEGFVMTFTMLLDHASTLVVTSLVRQHLFRTEDKAKSILSKSPNSVIKRNKETHISFHHFLLPRGTADPDSESSQQYVITPSVKDKVTNLARVVSAQRYPVLIQGPTSSGKTSIIEYLAARTGHRFVRINNHEHTDIQEYLGTYASDPLTGKLVFREGLLVQALRRGDWIVLDELNLAPTDVLEALNRLLDDNRELVIPETQEVIRPHPHFMLFATQNPPNASYGGRKALSRAFRSRFLEMHFDDVPREELETILETRCRIAPSYAKKIVAVFDELQHRRQAERVFEEKQSFATLRDLFRWGNREAVGYEQLAQNGYFLIAERARSAEDRSTVKDVLERVLRVQIDTDALYEAPSGTQSSLVWTAATKRLFTLVAEAVKFGEPVLLVGETGTGKTSVCQQLATSLQLPLRIVNCHLNTDAADILGGYRPARSTETSALFEWHDGPLVESMRQGGLFLMDEISLADDSVLERLNSVLEPAKTLVLAEKGGSDLSDLLVRGQNTFHVLATMNPGGDFGKKELSPALRNRFTEIWVPSIDNDDDLHEILVTNVSPAQARASFDIARNILTYSHWFAPRFLDSTHITLRGLLAWSEFIRSSSLSPAQAFVHGALMTLVDGLGSLPALATSRPAEIDTLRYECVDELKKLAGLSEIDSATSFTDSPDALQIGPFSMSKPTPPPSGSESDFNLHAPTPRENCLRLLRALQIPKSVLLEGSPGVGKTSLVSALARSIGHPFIRINLSDQTDLSDLFGSDMPVDGGAPGQFAWRDAPFLTALQNGSWVLLDEMNLAPQPVLEGLNSCLDHRGEVFIPELGRTFPKHPSFRIFAAQNPTHQGGSRKGLPRSFVDRFTQVFVAPLTEEDLVMICKSADSSSDSQHVESIVRYSMQVLAVMGDPSSTFGSAGAPWDFNLRDILRWQRLLQRPSAPERLRSHPIEYLDMLVLQRFRTFEDRRYAQRLAETLISSNASEPVYTHVAVSPSVLIAGHSKLPRLCSPYLHQHLLGRNFTPAETTFHRAIESVSKAVEAKWMVILTGDAGVGKSSLLRSLALSTGNALEEFGVSHQTDALELLGSYEQADWVKAFGEVLDRVESLCLQSNDILPLPASPYLTRAIINAAQKLRFQLNSIPSSSTERQALVSSLRDLLKQLPASKAALEESAALLDDFETRGAFQWQDGPLIRALVEGRWFVIDNANLCPGSVLDRLNSLVETDGHLLLNEHTSQSEPARILRPHENFRIFLTYNPKHGEVSRAMRNRGIEVHLDQHKASAAPALFHPSASCLHLDESSSDALDHTSSYPNSDELPQAMVEQTPIALSATARLPNVSDIQLRPIVHQSDDLVKIALRQACFPETLSSILPLDPFLSYLPTSCLEVGQRVALSFVSRRVACAAQLANISFDTGFSVYNDLIKALQRETLKRLSSPAVSPSFEDQQIVFLIEEMVQLLKMPRIDQAAIQEVVKWIGSLVDQETRRLSYRDTISRLSTVRASTELRQGRKVADIWSAFFVAPNSELWQLHRNLCLTQQISSEATEDLRRLVVEIGAALRYSASRSDTEVLHLADIARSLIKTLENQRQAPMLADQLHNLARMKDTVLSSAMAAFALEDASDTLYHTSIRLMSPTGLNSTRLLLEDVAKCMGTEPSRPTYIQRVGRAIVSLPLPVSVLHFLNANLAEEREKDCSNSVLAMLGDFKAAVRQAPLSKAGSLEKLREQTAASLIQAKRAVPYDTVFVARELAARLFKEVISIDMSIDQENPPLSVKDMMDLCVSQLPEDNPLRQICSEVVTHDAFSSLTGQKPSASADCLAVGFILWKLYVTDVPFDPAGVLLARSRSLEWQKSRVFKTLGRLLQKDPDFALPKGAALRKDLQDILDHIEANGHVPYVPRPEDAQSQLHSLFDELADADSKFFQLDILESLSHFNGTEHPLSRLTSRIESALTSLKVALHRLDHRFVDLSDLTHPPRVAMTFQVIGLQYILADAQLQAASVEKQSSLVIAQAAITYPSWEGARRVASLSPVFLTSLPSYLNSLHHLQALSYSTRHHKSSLPEGEVLKASRLFRSLYTSWNAIRERSRVEEAESQSIYRSRDQRLADIPEDMTEEEQMATLFGSVDKERSVRALQKELEDVSSAAAVSYLSLFGARSHDLQQRHREVDIHITALQPHISSALSEMEHPSSFVFAINGLLHFGQNNFSTGSFNFYKDAAPSTCSETMRIAQDSLHQVTQLVQEFPDQMILRDLEERLNAILAMPLSSSARNALSAIEQLIITLDDWESVASKSRSLSSHRAAFVQEVIRFRQLELSSWPALLDQEFQNFSGRALVWLMDILELVTASEDMTHDPCSADSRAFFDGAATVIQSFIASSPMGQFPTRLSLLWAATHHAHLIGQNTLANIFLGVAQSHQIYSATVEQALARARDEASKSIQDQIKLASWRDTNTQALQQSSYKSHYGLYKVIRSYRQSLQRPAVPTEAGQLDEGRPNGPAGVAHSLSLRLEDPPVLPSSVTALNSTQVLATVRALHKLGAGQQRRSHCAADLLTYRDDLHDVINELRTEQIKGETPEERSKQVASLISQKKRATAEVLKELKRLGLSQNPPSRVLEDQQSLRALLAAGSVDHKAQLIPTQQLAFTVDATFYRLIRSLPSARLTPSNHHDDISSQDISKAVGSLESGLALVLSLRSQVGETLDHLHRFSAYQEWLGIAQAHSFQLSEKTDALSIYETFDIAFGIASALEELLATLSTHAFHAKVDSTDVEPLRTTTESLTGEASQLVEAVRKELPSSRLCHDEQIRLAIHDHLADQLAALQTRVHTQLESVSLRTSWKYLVLPVLEVVQSRGRSSHHLLTSVQPSEEQIRQAHEQILTSMLMTVQDLDRLQPASEVPSGDTGAGQLPKFMCTTETRFQSLRLQAFRLPTILDHFKSLFQLICKSQKYDQHHSTTACLQRVLAFTQPVHNMLLHSLSESAQWHAALVKVLLLVENSLLELSEKGFCRPNESEDDGTGGTQGEGEMDLSEGMGMGSGKGAQDVSNQIENEEQVQGLQNDPTEEDEEGPEDGSDKDAEGIDMSGGLDPEADDARTEDVEKSEEDGDDEKDDGDDQEDPEDAVDNVDPLASTAVDEKFWGDQDQDPSKQTDEQTAQEAQQSTEQQSEGNMGERQNHSSGDANDTQKDEPESNSPDTNSEDLPSDQPQTQNETVDMPEGEHLDMPEDLDLEGDQEDQEMHSEAGDDDLGEPPTAASPVPEGDEDMATNTLEEDMSKTDQDEATDLEGGLPDERPADPQCEGGDESVGQGIGASAQEASEDQTNQHEEPKESTLDEREKQASGETGGGEGQGDAQAQDMDGAPDPNVQLAAKDSNINERPRNVPLDEERQLSDTLDRWTRRLQALEATNDENEVSQPKDGQSHEQTSEIKDVQYVHENQASEHQALGAADAHQQISASDLGNVEADMADPMNIDDEDATLEQQMPPEPAALELGSTSNEVSDRGGTESRALTSSEIRGDLQTAQQPNVDSVPVDSLNIGDAEDDGHREDPQALQSLNAALLQWQTSDKQHMSTSQAWKMYCNLTRSASFHLTEQLRLILEPTQATRLQGDYRTGKRLNMKRLIPYIASEFTKDKIWLRRTRPSDRSYQVLIALDDSKSMADPDMVHLTFQTLALVTSALERLEVGQVAVESFGSQTRVLHDFQDGNIGISNGQKLLDGVTFTQSKTDYMQLLRTALQRFADARSLAPPSTNGELWQLMFIISDGSMDNFESVRSCLRQATQNKVFIVFVIVDSASRNQSGAVANTSTENQSILERRFARVGTNSSGQLDIQEARYMDLFPFDYYVVLKEAASLPDVLCRTLRQFFEMVQGH